MKARSMVAGRFIGRALILCGIFASLAFSALAQSSATRHPAASDAAIAGESMPGQTPKADKADEERRKLRVEVERLRATVTEQLQLINKLQERIEQTGQSAASPFAADTNPAASETLARMTANTTTNTTTATQPPSAENAAPIAPTSTLEERLSRVEAQAKQTSESSTKTLESLNFSGEVRLRYESVFGQLNTSPNGENPAVLGNELSARNRLRIRARLAVRGKIGKEFDWGLRLSTGSTSAPTSTNQTLTDFYSRKPFSLDQVYITYKPARVPGLRLQGGKFEVPWLRTDLTFDKNIHPEGLNDFGYTFMNIGKDAVLTPFNYDDLMQQSDVRAQRFAFAYAADSRVILSMTGIVAKRLNGLRGVFGATPAGSLNTPTTRLQFDTTFRF